jgi:hypothetical protein
MTKNNVTIREIYDLLEKQELRRNAQREAFEKRIEAILATHTTEIGELGKIVAVNGQITSDIAHQELPTIRKKMSDDGWRQFITTVVTGAIAAVTGAIAGRN